MEELIVRSLQNRTSPAEERRLREWRAATLGNERTYREITRVWHAAASSDIGADASVPPGAAELLGEAGARRARRIRRTIGSAAAVVAIGLGLHVADDAPQEPARIAAEEFMTGRDERVTARLSDGSVVRLGPESRLRFQGGSERRDLWLDGVAFFAVAHDPNRPFVVRTRAGEATALGTRFAVRLEEFGLQLVVVEGRVALAAEGARVEVGAGELSRVQTGTTPTVRSYAETEPVLGWMGRVLLFQATPLRDAASEIRHVYGVPVVVSDSSLAEQTITAAFTDAELKDVLDVVCRAVEAHCSIGRSQVRIDPIHRQDAVRDVQDALRRGGPEHE